MSVTLKVWKSRTREDLRSENWSRGINRDRVDWLQLRFYDDGHQVLPLKKRAIVIVRSG